MNIIRQSIIKQLTKETIQQIEKSITPKDIREHFIPDIWITINPKNHFAKSSDLLFKYKDTMIRYYKSVFSKRNFQNEKDKQLEQCFCLEYGSLTDIGIKQPHIHCLLKSNQYNDIEKLVNYIKTNFKKSYPDTSIDVETKLDPVQSIVKQIYIEKETGKSVFSRFYHHFDLMNKTVLQ